MFIYTVRSITHPRKTRVHFGIRYVRGKLNLHIFCLTRTNVELVGHCSTKDTGIDRSFLQLFLNLYDHLQILNRVVVLNFELKLIITPQIPLALEYNSGRSSLRNEFYYMVQCIYSGVGIGVSSACDCSVRISGEGDGLQPGLPIKIRTASMPMLSKWFFICIFWTKQNKWFFIVFLDKVVFIIAG